jgi:tripartite-type tricarboxylate transporter receptor subunit TctC
MNKKSLRILMAALLLSVFTAATAQQFAGKDVTMIVNYSVGGPTDIEARMVARFLPKYLQGVRSIVVRNIGGAGGAMGVNQLGASSSAERWNIGFFTWDPMDQLIQNDILKVKYNDLKFIGAFRQVSLVYIRPDTPPGLKRSADVVKAPMVKAGVLSVSNHATVRQRLAFDLLGVNYQTIPGYRGLSDIEMAMHQGDLNAANTSLPGWFATVKPRLADKGIVMPLFQYDYQLANGSFGRSPELPDVPSFSEVYRDVKGAGASPSGEKWQALQLLSRIMDSMYRTVFMPPNAPPAAVEEMRAAFEKLSRDPEFISTYERIVKTKPRMIIGAPGDAIIQELGKVPPQMVTFFRTYIDAAR